MDPLDATSGSGISATSTRPVAMAKSVAAVADGVAEGLAEADVGAVVGSVLFEHPLDHIEHAATQSPIRALRPT